MSDLFFANRDDSSRCLSLALFKKFHPSTATCQCVNNSTDALAHSSIPRFHNQFI